MGTSQQVETLSGRGFGSDIKPSPTGPTLDAAALAQGAVVKHTKTEVKSFVAQGENRKAKLHTFQLPVAHGAAVFAVWGSMQLDQKLKELKPGAVVLLQYEGREPNAPEGRNPEHKWTVRPWTGTPQELRNAVTQEWGDKHAVVNAFIREAVAERAGAVKGTPGAENAAPPHTDDDAPIF